MAHGTAKKTASSSQPRERVFRLSADKILKKAPGTSDPPTRPEIRQMAEALGRLADEGRLRILFLLEESPRNVAALGTALGQDRHSLSHHLRILRVSGLILSTRNGRRVDYSLTSKGRAGVKVARSLRQ
jgi:DNA-binding transcriptional ArsR family regulator